MDPKTQVYDICRHYVKDHADSLTPELYERIMGMIRSRNLKGLATIGDSEDAYSCLQLCLVLRQISAFFKKNVIFSDDGPCWLTAKSNFALAESLCRRTNRRVDHFSVNPDRNDPDINLMVIKMRAIIARTLGDFSPFLADLPSLIRVTPGATSTLSRKKALPYLKLGRRIACTPKALPYLMALAKYFNVSSTSKRFDSVVTNRVVPVLKNYKTHRTIACEPTGNVPLQLAFDGYTKGRLLKLGVDLRSQFRNQEMARDSSISGDFATLDLSMASDTLAFSVIETLLPEEWFSYVNALRSPFYRIESGPIMKYSKFSSMGNGTTFPLETLVFAAACKATGSRKFSVYGDDIIIETENYEKVCKLLKYLGFLPNHEKSFSSGSFRESCGTDWFDGKLVTPFYIRDWSEQSNLLCHNVNGLASLCIPGGSLSDHLLSLIANKRLPLVPWNEDTMSGIMIDPTSSYHRGLIRTGKCQEPQYKAFVSKSPSMKVQDSTTSFLWHLSARDQRVPLTPVIHGIGSALESSLMPTLTHKFVRKWVRWLVPAKGVPVHLYWWTDLLLRASSGKET